MNHTGDIFDAANHRMLNALDLFDDIPEEDNPWSFDDDAESDDGFEFPVKDWTVSLHCNPKDDRIFSFLSPPVELKEMIYVTYFGLELDNGETPSMTPTNTVG